MKICPGDIHNCLARDVPVEVVPVIDAPGPPTSSTAFDHREIAAHLAEIYVGRRVRPVG
jgi:hypothetical protein